MLYEIAIHPSALQLGDYACGKDIMAYFADHLNLCAEQSGRARLVRSLSADEYLQIATSQGFAGRRDARYPLNKVDVQATEDEDAFHSASTTQRKPKRCSAIVTGSHQQ